MVEDTGDLLSLHVHERAVSEPAHVGITVYSTHEKLLRLSATSWPTELQEAAALADQALWAWAAGGLVGLQAYLMSRPDAWTDHKD